jgi:hypothetical protein
MAEDKQFVERLLEQETRISEAQLDEYRRNLERRLAKAARHERRMRALTLGTLVVILLGFLVQLVASSLTPQLQIDCSAGVNLLFVLLLLYFLHYRRKFQQIQQEKFLATLGELQREVAELRERERPIAK